MSQPRAATCVAEASCYRLTMSVQEIKAGLAELPQEQQDHLAAYLVHLRHQRDAAARREISEAIADKNPDHWLAVSELREKWKD